MARPLRIEFSGALYHVMARGNASQAIFYDNDDYERFLATIGRSSKRFDWVLWAYCLMPNHYHLLVETRRPTLARGMRDLNGVYAQSFNWRHDRVGHLFQGRYKAILVDKESYLLELSRYIVLNPVRAGLCARPDDWRWSSYRYVFKHATAPDWLAVRPTLSLFAADRATARRTYADFVAAGMAESASAPAVSNQLFVGNDAFVASATRSVGPVSSEIPRIQRAWKTLVQYETESADRNAAICAAFDSGAYTLTAIGEYFGLRAKSVSRIVRRRATLPREP